MQYLKEPPPGCIILRHDVDDRKLNSLQTARLENELGIRGTYYFRMVPESFDEDVIRQIYELGHEVGYHYEDLSAIAARGVGRGAWGGLMAQDARRTCPPKLQRRWKTQGRRHDTEVPLPGGARGGLLETTEKEDNILLEEKLCKLALESFQKNLETLRHIVPIETICMHGSPMSRWDNRIIWQYYDYHDFGIKGEPYFDLDFNEILYLTDTGRRWDGEAVSVRDKAERLLFREQGIEIDRHAPGTRHQAPSTKHLAPSTQHPAPRTQYPEPGTQHPAPSFHSTFDIIHAAQTASLPDKIMLTVHPQRWTNRPLPWLKELVWQNIKNAGKWVVVRSRRRSDF